MLKYEYWPWYLLFSPVVPIYFYGVIKTRRLLYFTAANPTIEMGGFFGGKKDEILELIPEEYKPKCIHVKSGLNSRIIEEFRTSEIAYPVIAKPNVGERGFGVVKIKDETELKNYSEEYNYFLIQEYIDYPLELGVFYYKTGFNESGVVSSITEKSS